MRRSVGVILLVIAIVAGFYVYSLRPPAGIADAALRLQQTDGFYIHEPFIYYILSFFFLSFLLGASLVFAPESQASHELTRMGFSLLQAYIFLAVTAALFFTPILSQTIEGSDLSGRVYMVTGNDYFGSAFECWNNGDYSLADSCAPKGGLKGAAVFAAVIASGVGAMLGVVGLVPVIGRLTMWVTTFAGVVVIAAIGYYALTQIGGDDKASLAWGIYLVGGGGLLALISGLAGMRGR